MAPAAEVRRRFRITGRVQGVGFRWWAWRQAQALGLRGTVANRSDGSVEVQAAGPGDAVEHLRSLLAEGPPVAVVREVEELPATESPLPGSFEIIA